jgi:hypothetical protein
MSLDTLTKYPVQDLSYAVYLNSDRAIDFGGYHLVVGCHRDPINGNNGSHCSVES